jgi:hypothetical protein
MIKKPYLVLVDGKLWARTLTETAAALLVQNMREKGINAMIAYESITGAREWMVL